jgi:hypothetical protein
VDQGPELDPSAKLDRMEEALERLNKVAQGIPLELYSRVARTTRVEMRRGEREVSTRSGFDEGTALRVSGPDGAFAAASGNSVDDLAQRVLIRVENDCVSTSRPQRTGVDRGRRTDHDSAVRLPASEALADWLENARAALGRDVEECWVEAALTLESWVSTGGLAATRLRCRGWALARLAGERPLLLARRRWSRLPSAGWRELRDERREGPGGDDPAAPVSMLSPESSARVVSALVRVSHGPTSVRGTTVGPGWRLSDRPGEPDALFGGAFDDSGAPTRMVELADGAVTTGNLAGAGHDRRPSFRDPPHPWPANVVVQPTAESTPGRFLSVSSVAIHPAGEEWIVEMGGNSHHETRKHLRIQPGELIRRCLGGVGDSRASHLGVVTPRLMFEI